MIEDTMFNDIPDDFFSNEPEEAPERPPVQFADFQFYRVLIDREYIEGEVVTPFTLPGVFNDKYDKDTKVSTRVGLKEFGRKRTKSSKSHLHILVIRRYNKDQQEYQTIKQWPNWINRKEKVFEEDTSKKVKTPNWWSQHQFPVFKQAEGNQAALVKSGALALKNGQDTPDTWVPAKYEMISTGLRVEAEFYGEPTEYIKSIVGNIVLYSSKEEQEKARVEVFGSGEATLISWYDGLSLPEAWQNAPDTLRTLVLEQREKPVEAIVDSLSLGEDGTVIVKTILGTEEMPF